MNELAKDLCAMQNELSNPAKNAKSHGFNYADLPSLLDLIRDPMAKNGFSFVQCPISIEGQVGVKSILLHKSGESIQSEYTLPIPEMKGKQAAQCAGAAITYARRYALAAMFGIVQTDDVDSKDWNQPPPKPKPAPHKSTPQVPRKSEPPVPEGFEEPARALESAKAVAGDDWDAKKAKVDELISLTNPDLDKFFRFFMVAKTSDMDVDQLDKAIQMLEQKRAKK